MIEIKSKRSNKVRYMVRHTTKMNKMARRDMGGRGDAAVCWELLQDKT